MTTPENPSEQADDAVPHEPSESSEPSLTDRLAQLEPAADDPPLDVDPYDDLGYDEPGYDEPGYDAPPRGDDAGYTEDGPEIAPAGDPAPVAAEAADETADAIVDAEDGPAAEPPYDASSETAVLDPAANAATEVAVPMAATTVVPPTPTELGPEVGPRRRRRISSPVVALLLMTALMAAATTYLWLQVRENRGTDSARKSGLEASRDAARLLFSYDYRTLDKDFSIGRGLTTGAFRTQYARTTTKVVTDVAKQYKAVVKANVVSAGVVRATPDTVVTVVYVNQVTTSTRVTGDKVDLSRVKMTLRRVSGRWLVESVNAL